MSSSHTETQAATTAEPLFTPDMLGPWIGDVRGTAIGHAYAETSIRNSILIFDLRVNVNNVILVLEGLLKSRPQGGRVVDLKLVAPAPTANEEAPSGEIELDQFSPERITGRWKLSTGGAGQIWLVKSTTQDTSRAGSGGTNVGVAQRAAELVAKEETLPSMTIFRKDLEAVIQRLSDLVPLPAKVVVTAEIDRRNVIQFADDFLKRADLPRSLIQIKLNISDAQPFAKTIIVTLSPNDSKIYVQSGDATWTVGAHEETRQVLTRNLSSIRALYQKHGLHLNSLLALVMIVVVPDLPIVGRAIFVLVVVAILAALLVFHRAATRTTIYLDDTRRQAWTKEIPSTIMGLAATAAAAILTKLYGYLATPEFETWVRRVFGIGSD
jgi:hypothetical protein